MYFRPVLWTTWLVAVTDAALFQQDSQAVLGGHDDDSIIKNLDKKPKNIVFILSDDQDAALDSLSYMPLLDKYIANEGTSYTNHFTTTAICCPSRVSLWTGKQPHNTNVTDVNPPYGKYYQYPSHATLFEHPLTASSRRLSQVCITRSE